MNEKNKDFLDENVYNYIDGLSESSERYKNLSGNIKDRLSELFESIEDEDCTQILTDIKELHEYLITLNSLSTNELIIIKNNGKKLIEKYNKHKDKINSLKIRNTELEEELSTINEQKEKILTKNDELNDEYYKLYQEKNNLELEINIKQTKEAEKQKKNNVFLNDQINLLNENNELLNKQIMKYKEEINDLSNKNEEIFKINKEMKEEIICKDQILKMSTEKYCKLNDEKDKVLSMNRGLQKTIEELDNQCKNYQILVKQLMEKINKYEKSEIERKITCKSILSETDSINKKRRLGIDYTGRGVNLDELLVDQSDVSDDSYQEIRSKSTIKLEITRMSFKEISKCNQSNNKGDNSDTYIFVPNSTFFYELLFRLIDL